MSGLTVGSRGMVEQRGMLVQEGFTKTWRGEKEPTMTNDAKFGLILGLGTLIAVAVLFYGGTPSAPSQKVPKEDQRSQLRAKQ